MTSSISINKNQQRLYFTYAEIHIGTYVCLLQKYCMIKSSTFNSQSPGYIIALHPDASAHGVVNTN